MKSSSAWILTSSLTAWAATIPILDLPIDIKGVGSTASTGADGVSKGRGSVSTGGTTFSLGERENLDYKGGDAPSEMLKAHTKYGQDLSSALSDAVRMNPDLGAKFKIFLAQGDVTGSVINYPPPFYDIQYVVPVLIGTPPQETYLNLDTGSSDLWTFSTDTYKPQVREQTLYAPEDSSTSEVLKGEAWSVRYGDGAGASGIVYVDRVQLGETFFDRQAVQAAIQVSMSITSDSFSSGIIGLGMSALNTVRPTRQKTYIDNIKNDLALPVFTANLKKGIPGNYNFGFINESEHTGEIGYTPIDRTAPYWKITVAGYQVGAEGEYRAYPWPAIVDTGTSLLLLPDFMVDDYYAQVNGSRFDRYVGMMVFDCDVLLPDFVFQVGGYKGSVPGHYINYGKVSRGTGCYGGIQSAQGIPFAVIGDVLLKSQFVVFDIGNGRVGFAAKEIIPPEL